MGRPQIVGELAAAILAIERPHPIRVAIDGVDAAGKTTLGDELARTLIAGGRPVIRSSVDGFHNPAEVRYLQGRFSPEGYYQDSFNYQALKEILLGPLGPGGNRQYREACFDLDANAGVEQAVKHAHPQSLLLCDGIFMLRSELCACWEYTIFVDVSFEVSRQRGILREVNRGGEPAEAASRFDRRYIPGQRLYLQEVQPRRRADVVMQNDRPECPILMWRT
jgi:uridine kinase